MRARAGSVLARVEKRFEMWDMVPRNQVSWAVFCWDWVGAALRMKKRENTGERGQLVRLEVGLRCCDKFFSFGRVGREVFFLNMN